jgi:lauroyl/myristoyl acyltransferase
MTSTRRPTCSTTVMPRPHIYEWQPFGAWTVRKFPTLIVVPLFALPLGRGRYRMVYEHPVEPPAGDDEAAILEFTQRCTDVLEMYVRRHPELWLWMHRRWR